MKLYLSLTLSLSLWFSLSPSLSLLSILLAFGTVYICRDYLYV